MQEEQLVIAMATREVEAVLQHKSVVLREEKLRGEERFPLPFDEEMQVRGPLPIGVGFQRAEDEVTALIGMGRAEILEIIAQLVGGIIVRMVVPAVVIGLPELDLIAASCCPARSYTVPITQMSSPTRPRAISGTSAIVSAS